MGLVGVKLTPFASTHDFVSIGDCRGPVEALPERIAHEGARCCVMAAYAGVDVSNQLSALGNGDASLQDSQGAALVQFSVDHDKGFGSSRYAPCLSPIRG